MGYFLAIEGGDGSGKGTHTKLLKEHLETEGWNVLATSFPQYGFDSAYYVERYLNGAYGSANDVPAELGTLPYALDRYAAKAIIYEHLAGGDKNIVLADRYMASNLAHQGAKIADEAERRIFYERTKITEYEVLGIPKPNLNIVLIMPPEHSQANVDKKAARSYTNNKRDIHEADASHLTSAKACFEELCELFPSEFTRINCIDGSNYMRSIDDIQADMRNFFDTQR